jgi:hypothetical protein
MQTIVIEQDSTRQVLKDTAVPGILFWLVGYLAGIVLFFTPYMNVMGWAMLVTFTPFTIIVTWWWFRNRGYLSMEYYAGVGIAWALIAVVLDYLFIVMLFHSTAYYSLHIWLYYALMFLIPVGVGMYLNRNVIVVHAG